MKLVISPTQALLILIEQALWKENHPITSPIDVTFFSQERSFTPIPVESNSRSFRLDSRALIELCVLGARTDEDKNTMMELFHHPLLSEYEVSTQFEVINNDAVRRFLETKLAETSLRYGLERLSTSDLNEHFNALTKLLVFFDPAFKEKEYLHGVMFKILGDDFQALGSALRKESLSADDTQKISFSANDWNAMSFLWHFWIRSYTLSGYEQALPIKIYDQGFFEERNRSRQERYNTSQGCMYSNNVGIFKSVMPTPAYSTLRTKHITEGSVLSDYRTYELGAWYRYNYEYLVHPFVNSISGTTLVQLRVLAAIKQYLSIDSPFMCSKDKLADYFRLFSALLLYGCGGHSWFELLEPITLTKVREEFCDIPGFDELDMEYILFHNNAEAMKQAIDESIQYNRLILQRAQVRNELKQTRLLLEPDANNDDHYMHLVFGVLKEGEAEYNRWARYNFKHTYGSNVNQLDSIYELFDNIEDINDEVAVCSLLNHFFSSKRIAESCKQCLYQYIQFKTSQASLDDHDYSFLQGPRR